MVAVRSKKIEEDELYELVFGSDWRLIKTSHGKTSIIRELFEKLNSGRFNVKLNDEGYYLIESKKFHFQIDKEKFENWYLIV